MFVVSAHDNTLGAAIARYPIDVAPMSFEAMRGVNADKVLVRPIAARFSNGQFKLFSAHADWTRLDFLVANLANGQFLKSPSW
jgi:hypothetical protein